MDHCQGVFRHFPVQQLVGIPLDALDGIEPTGTDAAAAAGAFFFINVCFVINVRNGITAAFFGTAAAAPAKLFIHLGFPGRMLFHLPGPAAAAHAHILHRSAEPSGFMAFEMGQADEYICIHDGTADFGLLDVLPSGNRYFHFISAPQSIPDDHLAPGGNGVVPIEGCTIQMVQSVLPAAGIQGVAVGKEGFAAPFFYQVCYSFYILRPDGSQIPQFPEMHLDSREFPLEVDISHMGRLTQPLELVQGAGAHRTAKIRKIHFCLFHFFSPLTGHPGAPPPSVVFQKAGLVPLGFRTTYRFQSGLFQ